MNTTSINEIVIGAGASGAGNNTVSIGNGYTTSTLLKGAVDISNTTNSISPGSGALIVRGGAGIVNDVNIGGSVVMNGTIQIKGGSPGIGKVLTADAAGLASWETPASMLTMGTISSTSTANGASIASGVLKLAPADDTNGGIVTSSAQTFAGNKTFGSDLKINGTTASTSTSTGALTVAGGAGIAGNAYLGGILNVSPSAAAANTAGAGTTIAAQSAGSGSNNKGGDINLTTGNGTGTGYGGDIIMNMGSGSGSANYGAFMLNTTSNPLAPTNAKGMFSMLIPSGMDGMNIKSLSNGNNVVNIWQTGTNANNVMAFYKGDTQGSSVGAINTSTTATTYNTTSDYRLKTDFKDFSGSKLLDSIKVYDYQWKIDGSRSFGVKAHELQQLLPYAVNGEKDAVNADGSIKAQSVDYSKIVPILIKAAQEQEAIIKETRKENNDLKEQLRLQNERLERLEKLLEKK
jgi:hypothetical protein